MNNSERINALMEGRKPDRVPFFPLGGNGFAVVSNNYPIATIYNDFDTTLKLYRETALHYEWLYAPYLAYASMGAWEMGGEIKWPDGEFAQAPSIINHSITKPEEAFELELPDIKTAGMVPRQIEFYNKVASEPDEIKAWKLICQIEGVFTFASNIAGVSLFSRWLLKKPEAAHHLLNLSVEFLSRLARLIKDNYGTERVVLFGGEPNSSNQMISPKIFHEFALPHTRELHRRLFEMGFKSILKHICGDQNLNLPDWAKIPMGEPGFVSFGHEVDLYDAAKHFPKDVIVGNINPSLVQSSSPEEVYNEAKNVIEKGKNISQGFIFAPGCSMPPKSPPENMEALRRALNDFGRY